MMNNIVSYLSLCYGPDTLGLTLFTSVLAHYLMLDYPCSLEEWNQLAEREGSRKNKVVYDSEGLVLNAVRLR